MFLALASLGWPRSAFGQDKSADGGAFRSKVDLVSVYFTVRDDKKRLVSDLAQDSFSVSEDGQPQASSSLPTTRMWSSTWVCSWTRARTWLGFSAKKHRPRLCSLGAWCDHGLGFIVSYASRVETVQLPTSDPVLLREAAKSIAKGAAIGLPEQSSGGAKHLDRRNRGHQRAHPLDPNRESHLYDAIRVSTHRYLVGEVDAKPSLSWLSPVIPKVNLRWQTPWKLCSKTT
jgi:hypothetical protein